MTQNATASKQASNKPKEKRTSKKQSSKGSQKKVGRQEKAAMTQKKPVKGRRKQDKAPIVKKRSTNTQAGDSQQSLSSFFSAFTADVFIDGFASAFIIVGFLTGLAMLSSNPSPSVQGWLDYLNLFLGWVDFTAPMSMILGGGGLLARNMMMRKSKLPWYRLLGAFLVGGTFFGVLGLLDLRQSSATVESYGGLLASSISSVLVFALGEVGAAIALFFIGFLGVLLLFELSLAELVQRSATAIRGATLPRTIGDKAVTQVVRPFFALLSEGTQKLWSQTQEMFANAQPSEEPIATPALTEAKKGRRTFAKPVSSPAPVVVIDSSWTLPPWQQLLQPSKEPESIEEDIQRKKLVIEQTLSQFGIPAEVVKTHRGPRVTQYGVQPGFIRRRIRGEDTEVKVKVSKITRLQNDLALALAAQSIRMEAPVPGHPYIGIEVPNDKSSLVSVRGIMESEAFKKIKGALPIALGRDIMGRSLVADLARMPHLLIAGATGSGKSVCLNTIICSLLCHKNPTELKLIMVDPKMVELIGYNDIPHLVVPVVTDYERVVGLLRWAVSEMERRYKILSENRVRHLEAYNERARKKGEATLPYVLVIIDELADLMMVGDSDEIEQLICRLAQKARAIGIHLILATQRPSVNVVTGLIKANFPARLAFAVTSQIDSRVILDTKGAEALLGQGDMLYMASDSGMLRRAQGCYVSDEELDTITLHWKEQAQARGFNSKQRPAPLAKGVAPIQAVLWDELLSDEDEEEEKDELLPKARKLVAEAGKASVSMLQRRLRVGYARAARIVDLLEEEGTIGRSEGPGKHREVYSDE